MKQWRLDSLCRGHMASTTDATIGHMHHRVILLVVMKPSDAFQTHRAAIRMIVKRYRACNPRVFGSVAQGCDTGHSDLDILVDPTAETTLLDIGAIRHGLLQLLGVPVDVLTPKALPDKFRAAVLAESIAV